MKILRKLSNAAELFCNVMCLVLFTLIIVSAFTQVVTRFIVKNPWNWTDELCRYGLVWLTMFGAALGIKRKAHVAIDVILNMLPATPKKVVQKVNFVLICVLGVVIARYGVELCQIVAHQRSSVLSLPMWLVYGVIAVFGVLVCFFALMSFLGVDDTKSTDDSKEETA